MKILKYVTDSLDVGSITSLFTPVLFFMRHVNMSSVKKCSSLAENSAILTNNCHIFECFICKCVKKVESYAPNHSAGLIYRERTSLQGQCITCVSGISDIIQV